MIRILGKRLQNGILQSIFCLKIKGILCTFATTAALLYRMCGYQSIYVEGLVVPASAFKEKENGTYEAQVDGTMGHAWCEVMMRKQESGSQWNIRRHLQETRCRERMRQTKRKKNSFKSNQVFRLIVCVVFVAGAAFGGVFIQAVVRGKRHRRKDWDDSGRNRYSYNV